MGPIVLSTCLSRLSEPAARIAVNLARSTGAALHVVHAVDRSLGGHINAAMAAKESTQLDSDTLVDRDFLAFCERFRMADVLKERVLLHGLIADEVVKYAAKVAASYVVVGTSAPAGLTAAVLGSVADTIVRKCSTPVLIVRFDLQIA